MMVLNKHVPTTTAPWQLDSFDGMVMPGSLAGQPQATGSDFASQSAQLQHLFNVTQAMSAAQPSMMLKPDVGQLYQQNAAYLSQDLGQDGGAGLGGIADQLQDFSAQQFVAVSAGMALGRNEQFLNQTASSEVCMFFMRTGTCAFGSRCRFKHPMNRPQVQLNTGGYPMRQAVPNCAHYVSKGWCAFGTTCKFNHPEPTSFMPPMTMADQIAVSSQMASNQNPSMFPYALQ
jgi:hypothetical protein